MDGVQLLAAAQVVHGRVDGADVGVLGLQLFHEAVGGHAAAHVDAPLDGLFDLEHQVGVAGRLADGYAAADGLHGGDLVSASLP